jgi:hypothetical protein
MGIDLPAPRLASDCEHSGLLRLPGRRRKGFQNDDAQLQNDLIDPNLVLGT